MEAPDANCVQATTELGWIYLRAGQTSEATAAFQAALAVHPDFVEARLGLAKALGTN